MRLSYPELYFCDQRQSVQTSVTVCSVGSEAYRIWQHSESGQVLAVFRRSIYVQCDGGIFCIGLASLGKGPLHVLLASDRAKLFRSLTSGQPVIFDAAPQLFNDSEAAVVAIQPSIAAGGKFYTGKIVVSGSFRFSQWHSDMLDACAAMSSTEGGFGWLLKEHAWHAEGGLSGLSQDGLDAVDRGLRQFVFPALQSLYSWLVESVGYPEGQFSSESNDKTGTCDVHVCSMCNAPLSVIQKLLGAGPGLTPAGDDLLAGVLLALHCIHRADLAEALWQVLEPSLVCRTNLISSAHLRLAARGQCSESMLMLLEQFTEAGTQDNPDTIQGIARNMQALANRMGASSGWDTLAGIGLVVRAVNMRN